jgi:hypothetical protein
MHSELLFKTPTGSADGYRVSYMQNNTLLEQSVPSRSVIVRSRDVRLLRVALKEQGSQGRITLRPVLLTHAVRVSQYGPPTLLAVVALVAVVLF